MTEVPTPRSTEIRKAATVACGLFLVAVVYSLIFRATGFAIPCWFHKITGWYCPGCGVTRMVFALLQLDLRSAMQANVLVFTSLPFLIILVIDYFISLVLDKTSLYRKIPDKFWHFLLIIALVYGVLRNLPLFAFLAPQAV